MPSTRPAESGAPPAPPPAPPTEAVEAAEAAEVRDLGDATEARGCLFALSQPPLMLFLAVVAVLIGGTGLWDLCVT